MNAIGQADLSWRAHGAGPGGEWIDRHDANLASAGIMVGNVLVSVAQRAATSAPGAAEYDATRAELVRRYNMAFALAGEIREGAALDRAILSFGHSHTHDYADEQFVALWRTLEAATFCSGVRPTDNQRRPVEPFVASMVSEISNKWDKEAINRWHKIRNRILHEGATPELFVEVAKENADIYECTEAVMKALWTPYRSAAPTHRHSVFVR